jgi:hypothetical protein
MDESITAALKIFSKSNAFRNWDGKTFESRFNRAIFDVISYCLAEPGLRSAALRHRADVLAAFKRVCMDEDFRAAVTSTTKSKTAVRIRFSIWASAFGKAIRKKVALAVPPE